MSRRQRLPLYFTSIEEHHNGAPYDDNGLDQTGLETKENRFLFQNTLFTSKQKTINKGLVHPGKVAEQKQ